MKLMQKLYEFFVTERIIFYFKKEWKYLNSSPDLSSSTPRSLGDLLIPKIYVSIYSFLCLWCLGYYLVVLGSSRQYFIIVIWIYLYPQFNAVVNDWHIDNTSHSFVFVYLNKETLFHKIPFLQWSKLLSRLKQPQCQNFAC